MRNLNSALSFLFAAVLFFLVPVFLLVPAAPALAQGGDAGAGERVFQARCSGCHTANEGGPNRTGPNLFNAFGSTAGERDIGYRFSRALSSSGVTWSEQTLDQWLASPRGFIPGNRMSFGGLATPVDRGNVVAFLRARSTTGKTSSAGLDDILAFRAVLTQDQTVPVAAPVVSVGGLGVVLLNTGTNEISWLIDFNGLSGNLSSIHFHGPANPGAAAGILVDIGAVSGLEGPLTGTTVLTDDQVQSLLAGQWYFNLHTALNPSGEIRGQLIP